MKNYLTPFVEAEARQSQSFEKAPGDEPTKATKGRQSTARSFQKSMENEPSKPTKAAFVGFEGEGGKAFSDFHIGPVAVNRLAAEVCPVCHGALREQSGKRFRHLWCPQPGHFDAWRALDVGRLADSAAPIIRGRG